MVTVAHLWATSVGSDDFSFVLLCGHDSGHTVVTRDLLHSVLAGMAGAAWF